MKRIYLQWLLVGSLVISLSSCGYVSDKAKSLLDDDKSDVVDYDIDDKDFDDDFDDFDDDFDDFDAEDAEIIVGDWFAEARFTNEMGDYANTKELVSFTPKGKFSLQLKTESNNGIASTLKMHGTYTVNEDRVTIKYKRKDCKVEITQHPFETQEEFDEWYERKEDEFLPDNDVNIEEYYIVQQGGDAVLYDPVGQRYFKRSGYTTQQNY